MQHIDEATMHEFNLGQAAAFNAVFKYFYQPLSYFAFKFIKRQDEAQDIAITALTAVMQRHNTFTEFHKLQGYLYTAVTNKCANYIKSKKVTGPPIDEDQLPTEQAVEATIIQTEFLREVLAASTALAPLRKRVFQMHYMEGKTYKEISKVLNIKNGAVRMHIMRGITQLQHILNIHKHEH